MKLILVVMLLLAGCASQPTLVINGSLQHASESSSWQFNGRFGASHADESWNGGLQWRQQGNDYLIRLSGPLGQGSIQLQGDVHQAQLTLSETQIYENADAEELLWQHTGWRIPFAGMRYWLMGMPAPDYPVTELRRDELGRLVSLRQAGWLIEIRRYVSVQGIELPRKLFLQHARFNVRLVVDQWELSS